VPPVCLLLVYPFLRFRVKGATFLRAHAREVRITLLCLALLVAGIVLVPFRLAFMLAALALMWYYGIRAVGTRSTLAYASLFDDPVRDVTLVADDPLMSSTVNRRLWHMVEGIPPMVFPTENGLLVSWKATQEYVRSGQLCTSVPDAARWLIEADVVCEVYASGWNAGIYLYGAEEFPALLGIGFVPAGSPVPAPTARPHIWQFDGLAVQIGTPGVPTSMVVHDKLPVPTEKETHVSIVRENAKVTLYLDGYRFWSGQVVVSPKALCIGAFRWPIREGEAPNKFPSSRSLIRNVRLTKFT